MSNDIKAYAKNAVGAFRAHNLQTAVLGGGGGTTLQIKAGGKTEIRLDQANAAKLSVDLARFAGMFHEKPGQTPQEFWDEQAEQGGV